MKHLKKAFWSCLLTFSGHCTVVKKNQINQFSASVEEVIEFLPIQLQSSLGYDSLNTARGALFSIGLNFDGV